MSDPSLAGSPTIVTLADVVGHDLPPPKRGSRGSTKDLVFYRTQAGCLVPVNHKPDKNGYVRINASRWGEQGRDYLHRLMYRAVKGECAIPEGWELDHVCFRRDCCEPSHLWPIPPLEHRYLTQMQRWDDKKEELRTLYHIHKGQMPIVKLAEEIGIGPNSVGRWLKALKAEEAEDRERWASLG